MPETKYYDIYTSSNPSSRDAILSATACSGRVCYGHALSEVMNWYYDNTYMLTTGGPWFLRGGGYYNSAGSGGFQFNNDHGSTYVNCSYRIVLTS